MYVPTYPTSTPPRSSGETFFESVVNGIGFTAGAAVAGAVIAFVLCPAPGSAEVGAEIGRRVGGCLCGGTGAF